MLNKNKYLSNTFSISLKEVSLCICIMAAIVGVGVGFGTNTRAIADVIEIIKEVKINQKESQKINVEQTVSLAKQSIILKGILITQAKQNKVLEKLLDR